MYYCAGSTLLCRLVSIVVHVVHLAVGPQHVVGRDVVRHSMVS